MADQTYSKQRMIVLNSTDTRILGEFRLRSVVAVGLSSGTVVLRCAEQNPLCTLVFDGDQRVILDNVTDLEIVSISAGSVEVYPDNSMYRGPIRTRS
jgi:hypothetical protein